jgi:hypothetical protein
MGATISMTPMMFPGNGAVSDAVDPNYEVVCDEATGYFVSRRRADAPPLHMGPAPPVMSLREQALSEQASRAAEREKHANEGRERERTREAMR